MFSSLNSLRNLGCAAAAAACIALTAGAVSAQERTLTIASPGAALHFYPFYVAEAGGFFKEEGIKLDWVDVGAGSRQIAAVAGGSANFAIVGMQPAITARQNGADLVSVASLFNAYAMQLVLSNAALEKTGIRAGMTIDEKVERLKGVSVGVTGIGSTTDVILRSWLKARGKDPEQAITIQPLGNPAAMYAALEQGAVDGFVLGAPFPERAEGAGIGKIAIDALNDDIPELRDVPYTGLVTSGSFAEKNTELVQKVVNAITRAIKLTASDPKKASGFVKTYFKETDPALFDSFEPKYQAKAAKTPLVTREAYKKLIDWIAITSDAPPTVTYDEFIKASFAEKAAADILK